MKTTGSISLGFLFLALGVVCLIVLDSIVPAVVLLVAAVGLIIQALVTRPVSGR